MAEIKTGIFAKNVQKRLSRAQEKVLQKLGKADETKDEQFEQCVQNFKRQESEGSRLQREMRAYLTAVKAMQQASINLTESLHEVYEPDWHGKDDVMTIGKDCDALWEDFHQKLVDSTIITLDNYLQQFPDLKIRVAKRSRKLIDYDSARHHLETLQASTMRNDRKIMKAEDELKKAQKVFDELNVGLQDELPTLWDNRVGFYVNTFKSVTHIEAKFHREISLLCKQLYEVMTKLGEQHSDKMFTIQGAPSDSGPLRLARTPSPPDYDSPPDSPVASPNHTLRPVSPGPPRPKSPTQLKKGPPVPPPPKVTPTKELHQEQIINLFGDEFLPPPAISPSMPNERPGESLMDMDFDAFAPSTPIGQTVAPAGQALPWDMWSANVEPAQPPDSGSVSTVGAEESGGGDPSNTTDFNPGFPAFPEQGGDSGFVADWAADFGSTPENGDSVPAAADTAAHEVPTAGQEEAQDGAQSWPQADGWGGDTGEAAVAAEPQESEAASGDEVSGWDPNPQPNPNCDLSGQAVQESGVGSRGLEAGLEEGWADSGVEEAGWGDRRKSTPGLRITNELGQEIKDTTEGSEHGMYPTGKDGSTPDGRLSALTDLDGSGSEYETAEEWGDGTGHGGGWASADDEPAPADALADRDSTFAQGGFADWASGDVTDQNKHDQESQLGNDAFAPDWAQTTDQASIQPAEMEISLPENSKSAAESFNSNNLFSADKDLSDHTGVPVEESLPREGVEGLETQNGGGSEPNTAKETLGKDAMSGFESDPFAKTQAGSGFESDPFAESQGGTGFESDPFAESQGGTGFESDPFAESQGGTGFESDPFAESQGGTGFESDPFAESQGGSGFESDPFAESQGGGGFESDPFAEIQGGGGFESDPFAESQGGSGFESDPFAETQGGGGFESDPFILYNTQEGSGLVGDFATDPFAETTTEGGTSWPADPFGKTTSAGTEGTNNIGTWQEVSDSSGFFSDGQRDFVAFPGAGGSQGAAKEVSTPRAHKEPENSDLSEDEVANRRYGKLYQEIDTEKEEVTNNAFNGFSQDASAPAFFADFDKMNESTGVPATAATEADADTITAAATEAACEAEAGPEAAPEAAPQAVTETGPEAAPDATPEAAPEAGPEAAEGQEPTASTEEAEETESSAAPKEEMPAVLPVEEAETPLPIDEVLLDRVANAEEGKEGPTMDEAPTVVAEPVDENPKEATVATTEGPAEVGLEEEKMPIPSVVIEPASSNEGDDDRDGDIISPTTISDNGVAPDNQPAKDISSPGGLPPDFMYKVETLHDFEAANSDELDLKKGDVVLVVPTALAEDQDAGWLTGVKESEWSQLGANAHKGLFPENFTQRLD